MLDLQLLRDDPERVKAAIATKGADPALVDRLLDADRERRATLTALQTLQQQQGELGRQIGPLMKAGRKDEAQPLLQQSNGIKAEIQEVQEAARQHEERVQALLLEIPNPPHPSVPVGQSAESNAVEHEWGEKPSFGFEAKPHWDLAAQHGLIDFEAGAKVTGAGFPFYLGQGARLQRALIQFFLDQAVEAGYTEVQPPLLVNEASGVGTGQLPDKEGQMYRTAQEPEAIERIRRLVQEGRDERRILSETISESLSQGTSSGGAASRFAHLLKHEAEELVPLIDALSVGHYLIPTSEVPVTNLLRDEILDADRLPVKYAAYTPCFRREAGSYGKDVRGLNRLHQFDKVEIVRFVHPDESYDHLE
ncbi:MAG: aminoacyl--tRNA ligase-related protein, partial [Rubricoccaceae bacterium]|nr:aminoacyl--tRNA ligase-related protein [Rubricoccaceae bacterium]